MNLISQDYLMHYGVKGMKWGVRHDPERALGSRRKMKKAFKRAFKEDQKRKGFSGNIYTGTRSTGKNYDEVATKFYKEDAAAYKSYRDQVDKIKKKYHMRDDDDDPFLRKDIDVDKTYELFEKDVKKLNNSQLSKDVDKRRAQVAKKYVHQLNQAKLKDIGIKDVKSGEKYMQEYGLAYYVDKNGKMRYGQSTYITW